MNLPIVFRLSVLAIGAAGPLVAREAPVQVLEEVQVEADYDGGVEGAFLPDVEGTKIHAGKKTTNIRLDEIPRISNDNFRQVLALTPGLVLAEETTPLVSIGFRGYDPHRTQFFQVLEDGIPIHADMVGYPEAYYTPPLGAVERLEFLRGGAALMYGPQPAGALNFIMRKPPRDRTFTIESTNVVGSFGSYSHFSSLGGTLGRWGYFGYYDHQQSRGFREANSDYFLNAFGATFALNAAEPFRVFLNLSAYDETHGEPGGLTLTRGPKAVNYTENRNAASRLHDRMRISRYAGSLVTEWDISDRTLFTFRGWWDSYRRFSRRQNGGGFGTRPAGPQARTNQLETQQFSTFGIEPRVRHDWDFLGQTHTAAGGMMLYHTYSPRVDARGDRPTAMRGRILNKSLRTTWYYSVFAENRFSLGPFSLTPGVRLESIWQTVREFRNSRKSAAGQSLQSETLFNFVPLFGVGAEYTFLPKVQGYANISQAYRPPIFTQAVPTNPNTVVAGNLREAIVWNYEFGLRGEPAKGITWDTSFFLIENSDQIGTAANGNVTVIQNSGRSRVYGWDFFAQLDLLRLAAQIFDGPSNAKVTKETPYALSEWIERFGSLSVSSAFTLQAGEFLSGPNQGKTPQYLPKTLLRLGLVYNWKDRLKCSLMANFVGSSFADDTNTPQRFIPAYDVWDLTVEARIYKETLSIVGGINNLFNRDYYARIRSDGIDPAAPRNWYAGIKVEF